MKKFRILALVLAVLMVAALFAGCGKKEETTTAAPTDTTTSSSEATTTPEPKLNFDGYVFTFVGANGSLKGTALYYDTPDSAGKQEIMDAYAALETEYNCVITNEASLTKEALEAAFLAGQKVGDFIYLEDDMFGNAAVQGYARRLDTDEVRATGMDVLDPAQFDTVSINAGLIGGEAYLCRITNETLNAMIGTFYCFNKSLTTNAGYPADKIYQAVRDYTWTWDVVIDISRTGSVYNDETGAYDISGISRVFTNSEIETMCNGLVYFNGEKYVSGLGEVATMTAVSTVVNRLIMDPRVMYTNMDKGIGSNYGNSASRQGFYDQKCIFGMFDNLNDPYGGCNFPYGLVPLPRGGTMDDYVSLLRNYQGYICQTANQDWEKACAIMGLIGTALNKPEDSTVSFETMTYDAESIEMLNEYIFTNIKLDVSGFCGTAWDIFWSIRADIKEGMSPAAAINAKEQAFTQAIDEFWAIVNNR